VHMYCTVLTVVFRECLYRALVVESVICLYKLCVSQYNTLLTLLYLRSSNSSTVIFANVSTDTESTLQPDISSCVKECELMKRRSVGI
jgi:hypothetical protein